MLNIKLRGDYVRNIPFFTTEFGVASLTLSEIPYKGVAYVRIQDAVEPMKLIEEAAGFCRAAGASRVFLAGHNAVESFPLYTEVWEMTAIRDALPKSTAEIVPVESDTLEQWRTIYNDRMFDVPLAATMSISEAAEIVQNATGYFIYRDNLLLGIGVAEKSCIKAVISIVPGKGADVLFALNQALDGSHITLEVASANDKAIALYDRLGFTKTGLISVWHEFIFSVTEKYLTR